MAKLILSMDGLVLKEILLTKERMSIGRKASNDIQIDNLAISGEHAAVVTILNDSFLEDLNSTNGTLVNGQTVKKHFLKNGDVVELGKYKLKYVTEQVGELDREAFAETLHGLCLDAETHPGVLMDICWDDTGEVSRESYLVEVEGGKQVVKATLPAN